MARNAFLPRPGFSNVSFLSLDESIVYFASRNKVVTCKHENACCTLICCGYVDLWHLVLKIGAICLLSVTPFFQGNKS